MAHLDMIFKFLILYVSTVVALAITYESSDGVRIDLPQCFSENIPPKVKIDYDECYENAKGRYGLKIRLALMCLLNAKKVVTENGDVDMESYRGIIGDVENTKYGYISADCEHIIKVKQFVSCILEGHLKRCNPNYIPPNSLITTTAEYF